MAIATQHRTLSRTLLLLGVISLVACGGGGGGSKSNNTNSSADASAANSVASSVGVSSNSSEANNESSGAANSLASSIEATGSSSSTANSVSNSLASSVGVIGNSSSQSSSADTTPAAFSFTPTTDAALSSEITSNTITVSGINTAVPVSITGGKYSINGGAFTSAAGTASAMQTIVVKVMSSNANSTAVAATLTVGGVSATYTVTTQADAIPNAFTFVSKVEAELGITYTSNAITVSGIEVATAISITGGEYSINGGAFTSAAGTVTNGQTVTVKAVAPASTEQTQNAVLTIGGTSGTYSVTTPLDDDAPVAKFKFPTPYTMSEANSVKVRGTATDDHAITSVKVVVTNDLNSGEVVKEVIPAAEGDYSSWTVDVPLTALAENEIKVVATDDRINSTMIEAANKIVIRQADVRSAFPDEINPFDSAASLVFDKFDGRNRALVAAGGGDKNVIAVDLTTGRRSIAFTSPNCSLWGLTIDPISKHIFGACEGDLYEFNLNDGELVGSYEVSNSSYFPSMTIDRNNGRNRLVLLESKVNESTGGIFSFALDTKTFSTISAADQLPPFKVGESFLLDGDSYLVPGSDLNSDFGGQIISVNALDGTRKVLSDNTIGTGDLYGVSGFLSKPSLSTMVKDPNANRFFVFEYWSSRIFTVNQETMNRKLFSDISYTQQGIDRNYVGSIDMEIDGVQGHLYVADEKRQSIIVVDSETGAKVILSKSKNNR